MAGIEREISEGVYKPGDRLPSEQELCDSYQVSHITVRRALTELKELGLIYRHGGLGSFVARTKRIQRLLLCIVGYEEASWRQFGAAFSSFIGGVGHLAWEHEARLSIIHLRSGPDLASSLESIVRDRDYDGIVFKPERSIPKSIIKLLEESAFPYVVARRNDPEHPANCVISHDEVLAQEATRHLLGLGKKRVGVILGMPEISIFRSRLSGFHLAMNEAGLTIEKHHIAIGNEFQENEGYRLMKSLFAKEPFPDAVFSTAGLLTVGAYRYAAEHGIRIPEDVAIVGWDDMDLSELLSPRLSAVVTPHYEIGRASAKLLLELMQGVQRPPVTVFVEGRLVIRDSCGGHSR